MSAASKYVLLASVFFQRQQDGSRKRFLRGDTITGLSDEQVTRLVKARAIAAPGDVELEPAEPVHIDGTDTSKPGEGANKPVLVGWIFENVAKEDGSDYTKTELNKLKVGELRAIIDSVADEPVEGD